MGVLAVRSASEEIDEVGVMVFVLDGLGFLDTFGVDEAGEVEVLRADMVLEVDFGDEGVAAALCRGPG